MPLLGVPVLLPSDAAREQAAELGGTLDVPAAGAGAASRASVALANVAGDTARGFTAGRVGAATGAGAGAGACAGKAVSVG